MRMISLNRGAWLFTSLALLISCEEGSRDKNNTSSENNLHSKSDSLIEKVEIQGTFDFRTIENNFELLDDSILVVFEEQIGKKSPPLLESQIIESLYNDSLESLHPHYALGRFEINSFYMGYLIGTINYEGHYTHLWIVNSETGYSNAEFIYVSASVGDAGEVAKKKGWIVDLNEDGIPELLQRTFTSYHEIDSEDDSIYVSMSNLEVWEFDYDMTQFILKDSQYELDSLNEVYTIDY